MKKLIPAIFLIAIMLLACEPEIGSGTLYNYKVYGTADSIEVYYDGKYEPRSQKPDSYPVQYYLAVRYKSEFPLNYFNSSDEGRYNDKLSITNISDTGIVYIEQRATSNYNNSENFRLIELPPGGGFKQPTEFAY
ncbi:MAG: hypothetical protein CMF23_04975 [Ignavibacteriae bacterium]|nr:hypothetical protein [Ignavibacteriota bacterium]